LRVSYTAVVTGLLVLGLLCFLATIIHPLAEVLIGLFALAALIGGGNWLSDYFRFPVRPVAPRSGDKERHSASEGSTTTTPPKSE
jgi:hypothetical protein